MTPTRPGTAGNPPSSHPMDASQAFVFAALVESIQKEITRRQRACDTRIRFIEESSNGLAQLRDPVLGARLIARCAQWLMISRNGRLTREHIEALLGPGGGRLPDPQPLSSAMVILAALNSQSGRALTHRTASSRHALRELLSVGTIHYGEKPDDLLPAQWVVDELLYAGNEDGEEDERYAYDLIDEDGEFHAPPPEEEDARQCDGGQPDEPEYDGWETLYDL